MLEKADYLTWENTLPTNNAKKPQHLKKHNAQNNAKNPQCLRKHNAQKQR
jgi:hypothetical protein